MYDHEQQLGTSNQPTSTDGRVTAGERSPVRAAAHS
jgi:hypothetical protein